MKKTVFIVSFFSFFISQTAFAQNDWLWGTGGTGGALLSSLSTDNNGNCLAFGLFGDDTVHFGSYTFMDSTFNLGFFLVKSDPNGNIFWAKQVAMNKEANDLGQSSNYGMTSDGSGNIYCTGSFSDTIIFGSTTLINIHNGNGACSDFLAKYGPNGNQKWVLQFFLMSDSSTIAANAVSTDNKGNCYEDGIYNGMVTIGGDTLKSTYWGNGGDFLAKYDSNGNFKWLRQSTGEADYWYMTNDRYGNSIITGDFFDTVAFGPDTIRAQNYSGGWAFTTKYDSSGNVLWAKQALSLTHNLFDAGGSVAWRAVTDSIGNIYVYGYFSDTIVFAPDTLITNLSSG